MSQEAPDDNYSVGEKVRIIDGPFYFYIGAVEAIDRDRAKIHVMVDFFGRDTLIKLDFPKVEKT